MAENIQLSNYANNTQSGEHWGHLIDVKYNVPYPLGRRDLIFFIITSPDGLEHYVDDSFNPQFAVAVCNHTKLKSSKSKINLITRCLCREEHGISLMESYVKVPRLDNFLWSKEKTNKPYRFMVKVKTLNGNTVSNITHIDSFLYKGFQSIEQRFNTKNN